MKEVKDIIQNGLCTGCGLCESVLHGFKMKESTSGFLEPMGDFSKISEKENRLILESCPGLNQVNIENVTTKLERIWGKIHQCEIGHSTNDRMQFQGSSGGVLTAIGSYLIEAGLITGVLQNRVSPHNPLRNEAVFSISSAEVLESAGSRYSPTSLLTFLPEILLRGEVIAVIGKPCDISAVKNYLKHNPQFISQIPYFFSFFCAGQPSYRATDKLLKELNCKKEEVKEFRYRGHGWPGKATAITFANKSYSMSYEDSWGKILGKEIHFRCKICPDGIGIFADLVCADAWESTNGYPDFEEKKGQSLILARTPKGLELLNILKSRGVIKAEKFSVNKLSVIQPYQENRRLVLGARFLAVRLTGIRLNFSGFNMISNSKYVNSKLLLSNFYGTLKRSYFIKTNLIP